MLFYLLLFIITTYLVQIGSSSKSSQQPILIFPAITILSIIAALRSIDVGTDTQTYIELYDSIVNDENMSVILMILDTDLFFYATCYLAQHIGGIQVVFFCYSFLTFYFLYKALVKYRKFLPVWLGFILFLFFFYNASLNIMRQILAVSFILWSSTFLFEGKKKTFLILSIISIIFHMTAIIASGIIFVLYKISSTPTQNKKLSYSLFFIALIVAFLSVNLVISYMVAINFGHSYAYTSSAQKSQIGLTDMMISLFLIASSYVGMKRKVIKVVNIDFFYLSSIVCLVMFLTGIYNRFLMRMAYYNLVFACLYLPLIIKSPKIKKFKAPYMLVVLFMGFFYWLYLFVISGSNATIPYSTAEGLTFDF